MKPISLFRWLKKHILKIEVVTEASSLDILKEKVPNNIFCYCISVECVTFNKNLYFWDMMNRICCTLELWVMFCIFFEQQIKLLHFAGCTFTMGVFSRENKIYDGIYDRNYLVHCWMLHLHLQMEI